LAGVAALASGALVLASTAKTLITPNKGAISGIIFNPTHVHAREAARLKRFSIFGFLLELFVLVFLNQFLS
jgi:nickel-dependent lactate racemase